MQEELKPQILELETLIETDKTLFTKKFATDVIFMTELKANDSIEGYDYDIETLNQVVKNFSSQDNLYMNPVISNLCKGYLYIFQNIPINKETLKELYLILSKSILKKEDRERMGQYYRQAPVYMLKKADWI